MVDYHYTVYVNGQVVLDENALIDDAWNCPYEVACDSYGQKLLKEGKNPKGIVVDVRIGDIIKTFQLDTKTIVKVIPKLISYDTTEDINNLEDWLGKQESIKWFNIHNNVVEIMFLSDKHKIVENIISNMYKNLFTIGGYELKGRYPI